MTWWGTAPAVGTALLALLLPGLLVGRAAGVRGVLGVGLTPVLSVGTLAVTAVVASVVGVSWGPVVAGVGTLVVVVLAAAVRRLVRMVRPGGEVDFAEPASVRVAAGVGVLAGGAALAAGFARGVGGPSRWPQTFDAVFHLSASWRVLTTGDGSSLDLGTLNAPGLTHAFYPAAWHDLVALVAGVTGSTVVVSSTAVALVVVAVVHPLGCVALARVALGARPVAVAAAGALAAGVTASPVVLSSYGTLWPNALGTALLPAALALLVAVLGAGRDVAVGAPTSVVLLPATAAGLVLAHPNTAVSWLVLGVVVALVTRWPAGGRGRALPLVAAAVTVWLVAWSPLFAATRRTSWPARETVPQALGEWALLSPQRLPVPLVLAGLTLVGCVVAWRRAHLRWLLAVHVVGGGLFALVAGSDSVVARLASGPWYDDAFRLAALAAVGAVPLAALAVDAVATRLAALRRGPSPAVVGAALIAGVVVATSGLSWADTASVVARWYRSEPMLDPAAAALLGRLPREVGPDGVVAGNPFDGAALTGPLGDRRALFPHLIGAWDPDRVLVGTSLDEAARRPDVCAAVRRLGVTHVLTGGSRFWTDDRRRQDYAGLEVEGSPGFERVDAGGAMVLWRVTACGAGADG